MDKSQTNSQSVSQLAITIYIIRREKEEKMEKEKKKYSVTNANR